LSGIDLHELGDRVRRRLDDLFPEEAAPGDGVRERRERLGSGLGKLQAIAGELQWRIPAGALEAYARELKRLRWAFADERHVLLLIRVQSELCRFMIGRSRNIPPRALMVLMTAFKAMERVATDPELSIRSRRRLVERVLTEFMAFKHSLPGRGGGCGAGQRAMSSPGKCAENAGPQGARAYYLIPVEALDDLRTFMSREFQRLGRLMTAR
jgi:hypothetical protein